MTPLLGVLIGIGVFLFLLVVPSIHRIGPTEVGLVTKRFSAKSIRDDNPIAFEGEAGYQADLLMPGLRWKFWIVFAVEKFPWVQVPAGEIAVVIAQVGEPLPIGAKSAVYKPDFERFSDLRTFMAKGGQKGVQRPVLSPGTLVPIHPIGFLVITKKQIYGIPVATELQALGRRITAQSFGLRPEQLDLIRIEPQVTADGHVVDVCGVVTVFDGEPLPSGDIASRLGGYVDIAQMESKDASDPEIIEKLLGNMNNEHNNYQDFQAFLTKGGKIGLQHDTLLYGAYALNPFLLNVEIVPMLKVRQGEVAVVKGYVGLVTQDTSGPQFKFGFVVRPGHRGVWKEPLRTGKYAINPRCYEAEIVPTAILTLNWAEAVSQAHDLDKNLKQIVAKSREGIRLQHRSPGPDPRARHARPYVISMVGTMQNLVNEVLQAAVETTSAISCNRCPPWISSPRASESRKRPTPTSPSSSSSTRSRPAACTSKMSSSPRSSSRSSRSARSPTKRSKPTKSRCLARAAHRDGAIKGRADMQAQLAQSKDWDRDQGQQCGGAQGRGRRRGDLRREDRHRQGAEIRAVGLARAEGFKAQVEALGSQATALLNVATALAESHIKIVPDVLVSGGQGASSTDTWQTS